MRLTSGSTVLIVLHEEKAHAERSTTSEMNQLIQFDELVMAKPRVKKSWDEIFLPRSVVSFWQL